MASSTRNEEHLTRRAAYGVGRPSDADDKDASSGDAGGTVPKTNPWRHWGNTKSASLAKCLLCVICGLVFGFVLEKSRIFEPKYMRNQMVMSKFVVVKVFMAAVVSGMLGMSLLAMIPTTHKQFMWTCNKFYEKLGGFGVLSSIVGGSLLGIGMVLCGACPTTILCQLGAGLPGSGYAIAGGFVGTLIYGILSPVFDTLFAPSIKESSNPWTGSPYFVLALPLVAMFGILVCAFEILFPWTGEIQMKIPDAPLFERKAWPPYISGLISGLIQVPLILGIGQTIGVSSSLITVLSIFFVGPVKSLSPFIASFRGGFKKLWQVLFVAGIIAGAFVSSWMSDTYGSTKGVPTTYAFIGGLLIMLGSRIGGGCTSGHGLSGMAYMSIVSFIMVASMFAAAIPTAFVMQSKGILKVI